MTIVQDDIHMIMFSHRALLIDDTQATGHTQMNEQGADVGAEQQIFPASLYRSESLTGQLLC